MRGVVISKRTGEYLRPRPPIADLSDEEWRKRIFYGSKVLKKVKSDLTEFGVDPELTNEESIIAASAYQKSVLAATNTLLALAAIILALFTVVSNVWELRAVDFLIILPVAGISLFAIFVLRWSGVATASDAVINLRSERGSLARMKKPASPVASRVNTDRGRKPSFSYALWLGLGIYLAAESRRKISHFSKRETKPSGSEGIPG